MDVKDYVILTPGFQKSVNLAYDLRDYDKVSDFIPSAPALEILESLMLGAYDGASVERAHILTGPYGRGKSHLTLVLTALLREKDERLFQRILDAISDYSPRFFDSVTEYLHSERKTLPVIIQGSSNSLNQSFLYALQCALKDAGLEHIMPETHFQAAKRCVSLWEREFPETYQKFSHAIAPESARDFQIRLSEFQTEAYETFLSLYPQLTSGGQFQPFLGFDVVELYAQTAHTLKDYGYQGLFVVYDEFSKYLESNIRGTSLSDIKTLQDFAERCARSGQEQLHLLLIAHKDIENYIDRLPKNKIDGWRAVSERFHHLEMRSGYAQAYEIMGRAVGKTPAFQEEYVRARESLFQWSRQFVADSPLFNDISAEQRENIIYGCFPLHPVTAFLLPRLSELVAQNERTMFTFLCSRNKFTLPYYLENGNQAMLSPDAAYDYFEPILKREPYTSEINKLYSHTNGILSRLQSASLEAKIVKTLALIYIVNQFDRCPPTPDTLASAFGYLYPPDEIVRTLEGLENQKLLIYAKKSNGYLRMVSANANVQSLIRDETQRRMLTDNAKEILEDFTGDTYLYPARYNDENAIVRYFDLRFLYGDEIIAVEDWEKYADGTSADGSVCVALPRSEEQIAQLRDFFLNSPKARGNRVLFMAPKAFLEIEETACAYRALSSLMEKAADDEALLSEYEVYYEDVTEALDAFVRSFTMPELKRTEYFYCGERLPIYRKAQLSQQLSTICERVYYGTPIINNEALNKNELTASAANSRTKVIRALLAPDLPPMLGLSGTGQEISILRSALIATGVIQNWDSKPEISVSDCSDERLRAVLDLISRFFAESCKAEAVSFSVLYNQLIRAEYGIGMKRGPIPLYVAAILRNYRNALTILSNGQELEISADSLNAIHAKPEAYSVRLIDWNQEKSAFLTELEDIFAEYMTANEQRESAFSHIVKAMRRWFLSLPKCAKEARRIYHGSGDFQPIPRNAVRFANALKAPIANPHAFLFEKLPSCFQRESLPELAQDIRKAKDTLDFVQEKLIQGLEKDFVALFAPQSADGTAATSAAKDWYAQLSASVKEHVFNGTETRILDVFAHAANDSAQFLSDLAKPAAGLRLDDWSDHTVSAFNQAMGDFKKRVTEFHYAESAPKTESRQNAYTLTTIRDDGTKEVRTFDRIECSKKARLLKNDLMSSLEDMGQAISDGEKRQVLLEILESLR